MPLPLLTMVKWVLKSKITRQMPSSNLNSNFISETKTNEKLSPLFLHYINFIGVIKDVLLNKSYKNIVWLCITMDELGIRKYSKAENYTPKPNF